MIISFGDFDVRYASVEILRWEDNQVRSKPKTSPATKNTQDTSSDWVFMTPKKGKKKQEDQKLGYSPDNSSPTYSIKINNEITLKAFTISTAKYQELEESRGKFSPVSPTEERSPLEGTATRNNGSPLTGDAHHFIQAIGTQDESLIKWFEHTCNIVSRITKIHNYRKTTKVPLDKKEIECRINHIQALKKEIKTYIKLFDNMNGDHNFLLPLLNAITQQALPGLNFYQSTPEDPTLNDPYSVIEGFKKPKNLTLKNTAYFTDNHTAKMDKETRDLAKAPSEASTQKFPPLPEIHRVLGPLTLKLSAEDKNTPDKKDQVTKDSDTRKIKAPRHSGVSQGKENQPPEYTGKFSHTPISEYRAGTFGKQSKGKNRNTSASPSATKEKKGQSMAYRPR